MSSTWPYTGLELREGGGGIGWWCPVNCGWVRKYLSDPDFGWRNRFISLVLFSCMPIRQITLAPSALVLHGQCFTYLNNLACSRTSWNTSITALLQNTMTSLWYISIRRGSGTGRTLFAPSVCRHSRPATWSHKLASSVVLEPQNLVK